MSASSKPPSIILRRKGYSSFDTLLKESAGHWPQAGKDVVNGSKRIFSHLPGGSQSSSKFVPSDDLIQRLMSEDQAERALAEIERRTEAEDFRFQWKLQYTEQSSERKTRDSELILMHTWLLTCPDSNVAALLKMNVKAYDKLVNDQDPFLLLAALKDAAEGTVKGAIQAAVANRYNLCDSTKFKIVTDFVAELQRIQVAAEEAGFPGTTIINDSLLADKLMNNLDPATFATTIAKWHDEGDSWSFETALTEVLKWVNVKVDSGSLKLADKKSEVDVKARAAVLSPPDVKKKPGVRFEGAPELPPRIWN